ncbi:recombination protein RecT [Mesoaciditoga lauensis]|uniref:recombination protein RecT n=1 Tax=Mesoaciditoga lauensis TaxID=1495039 RepID=UPI0009E0618D|nr:recombination protein RecT [Mesoaciditoga lauensis]
MSTTKEVKDKLSTKVKTGIKPSPYKNVQDLLKRMAPEIQRALPKHLDADRIARIALTEMRKNPKLLNCSNTSLLGAIMTAAQLGLEPGALGHVYLIPYYNSKTKSMEVQLQIGYKGMLDLVRRSGEITSISAHTVHENDEFEFEYGLAEKLRHIPNISQDRGEITAVYAVAHFKDGGYSFLVMSKGDVEKIRKRSKSPNFGPWVTDYDAMARKTAIKQLCKYLPISVEIQKAIAADETTKRGISQDMVEDIPDETDWEVIQANYESVPEENETNDKEEEEGTKNVEVEKVEKAEVTSNSISTVKKIYRALESMSKDEKKRKMNEIKEKYNVKSLALLSEEQAKEALKSLE